MKAVVYIIPVVAVLLIAGWMLRPKTVKHRLQGSWICIRSEADFKNRAFQLLFYKNDTFYFYLKGRDPKPYARGEFSLDEDGMIILNFKDTGTTEQFKVIEIGSKRMRLEQDGKSSDFRRVAGLKTLP